MASIIVFTSQERNFLQETVNQMYQDDSVRTLEGPLLHSILMKLESANTSLSVTFDNMENERMQYMMMTMAQQFCTLRDSLYLPFIPLIPLSIPNPLDPERNLIGSIRLKLMAEAE